MSFSRCISELLHNQIGPGLVWGFMLFATGVPAVAQTNFSYLRQTGPPSNRVNLVILAEGYTAAQFPNFWVDATNIANLLLTNEPYASYRDHFNVAGLAVASAQSGSDHPVNNTFVATYFNSTYGPSDYYLGIPTGSTGQGRVTALLDTFVPGDRLTVLLVNDPVPGGSDAGGSTAVVSRGAAFGSLYSILPHETGHVFANLGDEYTTANPGYPDVEEANTTRETNRAAIKWAAWIDPATPIPTPPSATYLLEVGLFEGAHYHPTGWYRPKLNCMMRSFGVSFCEVCTEALVLRIYEQVRPLDDVFPTNTELVLTNAVPLNFSAQSVRPSNHDLHWEWRLNGVPLPGATNNSFQLCPPQIGNGLHNLSIYVHDPTPAVRADPNQRLRQSHSWSLQVQVPQLQLFAPHTVGLHFAFGITGSAPLGISIQISTNLMHWRAVATGQLTGGQLMFTNPHSSRPHEYFRVVTPP
jgi:hypothetical protein